MPDDRVLAHRGDVDLKQSKAATRSKTTTPGSPGGRKRSILHQPDAADVISVIPNRRATLFASYTATSVTIWNIRPSCMICSTNRTTGSIRTYGNNKKLEWSHDGSSLVILTESSYLLVYSLLPLSTVLPSSNRRQHARSNSHQYRQALSQHQPIYSHPPTRDFPPGAGEGEDVPGWRLEAGGVGKVSEGVEITSFVAHQNYLLLSLHSPTTPSPSPSSSSQPQRSQHSQLLRVPYPIPPTLLQSITSSTSIPRAGEIVANKVNNLWIGLDEDVDECLSAGIEKWDLSGLTWWNETGQEDYKISQVVDFHALGLFGLITSSGSAYAIQARSVHKGSPDLRSAPTNSSSGTSTSVQDSPLGVLVYPLDPSEVFQAVTSLAFNHRFALCAIGHADGAVSFISLPAFPETPTLARKLVVPADYAEHVGTVGSLAWTSDGHTLAVVHPDGIATWDVTGQLLDLSATMGKRARADSTALFWDRGNTDLYVLSSYLDHTDSRILVMPFGKNVQNIQPDPSNLSFPMFLSDDKVDLCQIASQPDDHILSPDARHWQSVKIPMVYIATNWPIRHACISADGKLLAVAGTNGLTHFSVASGRWKLFGDVNQEMAFGVQGGMVWYHHVLITGVESSNGYEIRLYSRDLDLTDANCLHSVAIAHPILLMTIIDNNLLVYSADNSLTLYIVRPSQDGIKLDATSRISFKGIIPVPWRVRAMSWIVPDAQRDFGDPADDLIMASMVILIDSRLVLFRPRKAALTDLQYDMHVLDDQVANLWVSPVADGLFSGCIWARTQDGLQAWLPRSFAKGLSDETLPLSGIKADFGLACLDMVPITVLSKRGLLGGLSGAQGDRSQTNTRLLLPTLIRHILLQHGILAAVDYAADFEDLPYFAYSLEVLLHEEVERGLPQDTESGGILPDVIAFIDHFNQALEILAACLRKMEMKRWHVLFDVAGQPRELFEQCMTASPCKARIAASYLLMLQSEDVQSDAGRVIDAALLDEDFELVQDVIRFLRSLDASGQMARAVCGRTRLL